MGRKGKFKYICEECNAENWLTTKDRNSRFMPKCIKCGSSWLEPSHRSRGPERLSRAREAARENIDLRDKKMGKK